MISPVTFLFVDEDEEILNNYREIFLSESDNAIFVRTCTEALDYYSYEFKQGRRVSVGFFDMDGGGKKGLEALIKKILSFDSDFRCVLVSTEVNCNLTKLEKLFRTKEQWIYLPKPFNRMEVRQIARNLTSSLMRKREEEKAKKSTAELNSNLKEKVSIKTFELEKKIRELKIINEIGKDINAMLDLDILLETIINEASAQLFASIGSISLKDDTGKYLIVHVASGPFHETVYGKRTPIKKETISGFVVLSKKPLLLPNIVKDSRFRDNMQQRRMCSSLISVPLIIKEWTIGVMHLGRNDEAFTEGDLNFFATLADQAAIAIENARLHKAVNDAHLHTIQALASTIDAKDPYTKGHSDRVTAYAVSIAHQLNWSAREVREIELAGRLHDIGKIGISDSILNKPGKLTKREFSIIKKHPSMGAKIISPVSFFPMVKKFVRYHHERFEGNGYPDKIKGAAIPLGARILSVADAYDAMISTRCYRKSFPKEEAVQELIKCAGTQFDPGVVDAFVTILDQDILFP